MFTFILVLKLVGVLAAPHKNDIISTNSLHIGTTGCPAGSVCVAFNLCKDSGVIKDGGGMMDIRFDEDDLPGECLNYYEICCQVYDSPDTIPSASSSTSGYETCGERNTEELNLKIIGDGETHFGEFPWMVAILTEESIDNQVEMNVYQCGGSLIHPKVVLTAAHCVFARLAKTLKVRAGEWDTQAKTEALPHQDRFVTDIKIHERFNKQTLYNDVALLMLVQPFDLADNIRTVCLPPSKLSFEEANCIATGWGKDSFGKTGKYSNILKKVELPMVADESCQESLRNTRLGPYFELHSSFVCAGGEKGKDTCKGDGGSPLICPIVGSAARYYQVGVVAWGIGCGDNIPAVYASVAAAREWIDRQFIHYELDNKYYIQ